MMSICEVLNSNFYLLSLKFHNLFLVLIILLLLVLCIALLLLLHLIASMIHLLITCALTTVVILRLIGSRIAVSTWIRVNDLLHALRGRFGREKVVKRVGGDEKINLDDGVDENKEIEGDEH